MFYSSLEKKPVLEQVVIGTVRISEPKCLYLFKLADRPLKCNLL